MQGKTQKEKPKKEENSIDKRGWAGVTKKGVR